MTTRTPIRVAARPAATLSRPARRAALIVHIAASGAWLALELALGALTLASGIALGLGTKWGLLRYRWVAVKLVLNVVLLVTWPRAGPLRAGRAI